MKCRILSFDPATHQQAVVALWRTVFGYADRRNDPELAIAKKIRQQDGLFFVAESETDGVVGTVMAGYDGHRGWIYSLAVAAGQRRGGIATKLMASAEDALRRLGCMKINLQVLPGNDEAVAFYQTLGFTVEQRVNLGKELPENLQSEELSDEKFLRQFEDCSFPLSRWTHRTHVKMAFLYLRSGDFAAALEKIRVGIKAYAAHHQVEESALSGYNETTTHAFVQLVHVTMQTYGRMFPTPDADSFCDTHSQLMSKHVLRLFYSPERRMHPDAKASFVPPDLTALPVPPPEG